MNFHWSRVSFYEALTLALASFLQLWIEAIWAWSVRFSTRKQIARCKVLLGHSARFIRYMTRGFGFLHNSTRGTQSCLPYFDRDRGNGFWAIYLTMCRVVSWFTPNSCRALSMLEEAYFPS
ncbi:hypothetical protein O6H91_21G051300 [Diphasiastrum complanatum]|uniref:Uncharacterized protein n=1 Tax=Diphasiastrum complanatum TaxID=34168 RepID=A0ACC2AKI8_DIPCM|nr:hypothetical protein O6H91_21G051300 [Diphasiastrum complanatum]